jgi:hypothetical protein
MLYYNKIQLFNYLAVGLAVPDGALELFLGLFAAVFRQWDV